MFYFDSSALVKRYVPETGTTWIVMLCDMAAGNQVVVAELTRVEAAAAFAAKHRSPSGITRAERDTALYLLLAHCDTEYQIAPLSDDVVRRAIELTQQHRLRGYDAVQLATALAVNEIGVAAGLAPLTFVAADDDLLTAAAAEGLGTENPNDHP